RPAQGVDHLGQGLDHAANRADAGFHPLDGWQRKPRHFCKRLLVDAQQRPRRPHLERRDHAALPYSSMIIDIPNNENDVKNIIWQAPSAWPKRNPPLRAERRIRRKNMTTGQAASRCAAMICSAARPVTSAIR